MKKVFSLCWVLVFMLLMGALTADEIFSERNYASFGISHNTMKLTDKQSGFDYKETYKGLGINYSGFTGGNLGIYVSQSIIFVQEIKGEVESFSFSFSFDRDEIKEVFDIAIALDTLFGIASRQYISNSTMLLFGGGLQISQTLFTGKSIFDDYGFGLLGAGGVVEVAQEISDGFFLSATLRGGYNFIKLYATDDGLDFGGGLTFTPVVGVGVTF